MLKFIKNSFIFIFIASAAIANAGETVTLYFTAQQGEGKSAGSIQITETQYGLLFTPSLQGFTPGIHGFHVHQNPNCADKGMAAGGHFDPNHTNKHLGPYNDNGHLGDLPALYANPDGSITLPVLAPRLTKISQIKNRTLMIHEGGDNYSDNPKPLGGGGARIACGVVE